MKNTLTLIVIFFLAGCESEMKKSESENFEMEINLIAENYVRLILKIGLVDENFVDSYYGSPDYAPDESVKKIAKDSLLKHCSEECDSLLDQLDNLSEYSTDEIGRMRFTFLYKQLLAVKARLFMLSGGSFTFAGEAKALYDITLPQYDISKYDSLLLQLEDRMKGSGSLTERFELMEKRFLVPEDKIEKVFAVCIDECRNRTMKFILLPQEENFNLEIVKGKPWSAYNWYKGKYKSLIQLNLSILPTVAHLLHLSAHEGFPGHHVYNALLEKNLVKNRGWVEFSIYPLFSQQSLIAEGTADYGMELLFPNNSDRTFIKNTLSTIAEIDTTGLENYFDVRGIKSQLEEFVVEIARQYLDRVINKEKAISLLKKYTLASEERAEQRIKFFETYGSYIVNYSLGQKLIENYINSRTNNLTEKWKIFETILKTPTTVSRLISKVDV